MIRRKAVILMGALALVAGACDATPSGESAGPATSASAGASTTRASGDATTSTPGTFITARECHSGSSPATFDDEGGVYAVFLTAIEDGDRPALTFDVVQWLVGEDAREAWQREYPDDPEGPPNDYFIVNENTAVRQAPVAPDVEVRLVAIDVDADADLDPATFEELPAYLERQPDVDGQLSPNPFWLTFDGGTITAVCEQFVP